ncbi:MAG: hypothetical protein Kow0054_29280 [Deferrisoma sp.]
MALGRILFVDDDENIRFLLQEELSLAGHEVVVAPDGARALELLDEIHPDLVILDLKMPGMDGLTVLGAIRRRAPDVPVVVFSAYCEPAHQALEQGANACVAKSADLTELHRQVSRYCA